MTAARLSAIRRMRIVVLSRYMKKGLVGVGVAEEQITVVPPFVHGLDPQAPPDGPPCVLFVGRLAATKGPMEALEAWRLSGLDLPFVVAGTGPLRAALEASGAQVRGWLNHQRLSAVYRSARVLALLSQWQEPFGIAGHRPAPPAGFERARLMGRLADVYEKAGTFSAAASNR